MKIGESLHYVKKEVNGETVCAPAVVVRVRNGELPDLQVFGGSHYPSIFFVSEVKFSDLVVDGHWHSPASCPFQR